MISQWGESEVLACFRAISMDLNSGKPFPGSQCVVLQLTVQFTQTQSVLQNILEFYAASHCTHEVPKVHCIVGFSLISMVNYACYTIWCFSQGSFELKVVRSSTTAPCTWFVTVRRVWIVGMRGPVALAWQNLENCKAPTVWTIASRIQKRYEKMRLEYLWAEKGRG